MPFIARAGAASIGAALLLCSAALAADSSPASPQAASDKQSATPAPFRSLEGLIGDWDTGPVGAPPDFVQRLSWGTARAYIVFRTTLVTADGEHLHFEGPILWNAASRRFDYLFAIEPQSGALAQERGEIYVNGEGAIIRDVTLTGADGLTAQFRQTIRVIDDDTAETSLMRATADGWSPTFPGSERLVMTRRD